MALRGGAPHREERVRGGLGLDSLGDEVELEGFRQPDDRADDGVVVGARPQVADESPSILRMVTGRALSWAREL